MDDSSNTAMRRFNDLCETHKYPNAPNTKEELLAFWAAGVAVGVEHPQGIERLAYVSNRMQEDARNSKLYDQYPALEELNDELLDFEDMDVLSENKASSVKAWHEFAQTLIERTKAALDY